MSSPLPVTTLDPRDVLALLAHRYPFLLVDRIEVLEPGRRVRGVRRVTAGEWGTGGPSRGVAPDGPTALPGLLVVESLAQTSGAILVELMKGSEGALGYFVGMERVRLRAMPRPGDTVLLDVELRSFRRGIARLRGAATLDGRTVATADFTTIIRAR